MRDNNFRWLLEVQGRFFIFVVGGHTGFFISHESLFRPP